MMPQLEIITLTRSEIGQQIKRKYEALEASGSADWEVFRHGTLLAVLLDGSNDWPSILEKPTDPSTLALMIDGLMNDSGAEWRRLTPAERLRRVRLTVGAFEQHGERMGKAWATFLASDVGRGLEDVFLSWAQEQLQALGALLRSL
jgi:hypothetical protein